MPALRSVNRRSSSTEGACWQAKRAYLSAVASDSETIGAHMTSMPHTIGADQAIAQAQALMAQYGFQHLPVLHGGRLAGVVSVRDLALAIRLADVDPHNTPVEDVMSSESYTAPPSALLSVVVKEMASHHYGSVIVVEGTKVVGIFTATDAVRVLAEML